MGRSPASSPRWKKRWSICARESVGARSASLRSARITLGRLGGARVALAVTGDGERNARRGLAELLAAAPVSRIIVAGVAGGLSPTLEVGALVVVSRTINEADGSVYAADPALLDVAATACGGQRGVAVTATRIADTVAEKQRLLALALATREIWPRMTTRRESAAVVDLESAAFAAAATRTGLPWVVLRAVSDTAADSVPALLNRSRDDGGAVRRASVLWGLLTNPRALRPLLELRESGAQLRRPTGRRSRDDLLGCGADAASDGGVRSTPSRAHEKEELMETERRRSLTRSKPTHRPACGLFCRRPAAPLR